MRQADGARAWHPRRTITTVVQELPAIDAAPVDQIPQRMRLWNEVSGNSFRLFVDFVLNDCLIFAE
jgi:hypothetical protein